MDNRLSPAWLAALETIELETSRAIKYVKGTHTSPETIRYLMMKIYTCNDVAYTSLEAAKQIPTEPICKCGHSSHLDGIDACGIIDDSGWCRCTKYEPTRESHERH